VSGHYARIEHHSGEAWLLRAPDPVKDQTYFLSHLSAAQLSRLEFPIGEFTKNQVRAAAEEYALPNRDRPDSQGICFLGKIRYPDFVRHYLGEREGDIVERETGTVLGKHKGFWFHTIGQRQGLGLGNGPWYVVGKNTDENVVYVSHATHKSDQVRHEFLVEDPHWISGHSPLNASRACQLQTKLRHGPELQDCVLSVPPDQAQAGLLRVELKDGDRGVAPGQFTVFYNGERCLGAAKISTEGLSQ
ncbi:MAG: tRNA 2-thiouridine(34) synthase MnmA, partial [Spirochaetaceae bacterium]